MMNLLYPNMLFSAIYGSNINSSCSVSGSPKEFFFMTSSLLAVPSIKRILLVEVLKLSRLLGVKHDAKLRERNWFEVAS